jgi:phosphoribosylformimino-5-aminoimidazole carboxamide ribonucleotide (ProFAR) isomerase
MPPFCQISARSVYAGECCDRENAMRGVNLAWFRELRRSTHLPIVAAGGISTTREIAALQKIGMDSVVGMACYKNRLR